jgi:sugar transferase (PEP-CTERM/EpsH1 system associated)
LENVRRDPILSAGEANGLRILWVKAGGLVPLDLGGRIRSYHLLRELARRHEVTLFTFYGRQENDPHPQLNEIFAKVVALPLDLPDRRSAGEAWSYLRHIFSGTPYTMAKFCRPEVARALRELLARESFDVLVCDFVFAAGVIPWEHPTPKVLFTHNVEAVIWKRQLQVARNPVWKAVFWREYTATARAEREYLRKADCVLAVSEEDRRQFSSVLPLERIHVIPTGVDTEYFQPAPGAEQPDTMVFTGAMDWSPNEDAMLHFTREVLPHIRAEVPGASLCIVGRNPPRSVQELGQIPGVQVTGTVPDIRPFLHRGAVYVVPIRSGSGTRLKIFEAMATGKAIVSTRVGAEGLPVTSDENIILADEPREFARQVAALLRNTGDRARLGRAARQLVEQHYSWGAAAAHFDRVLCQVAHASSQPATPGAGE